MEGQKGERGSDGLEQVKQTASAVLDQAKAGVGEAYGSAAGKAKIAVNDKKAELTAGLSGIADTLRNVGGTIGDAELGSGVTDYATKYTDLAADKLEAVGKYVEEADLRSVASDVEGYARRNPVLFICGAFAIGALTARFLKTTPGSESAPKRLKAKSANAQTPKRKLVAA